MNPSLDEAAAKNTFPDPPTHYVYRGRAILNGGSLGYVYLPAREDGTHNSDDHLVYVKPLAHCSPGALLSMKDAFSPGGSVIKNNVMFVRMLGESLCATWQAQSRAEEMRHEVRKKGANKDLNDMVQKALQPIRLAMSRTNATGRNAVRVMVLDYLEKV